MPLYRPSELREFLASLGIFPKKKLSQNFLIDGNVLKKIAALSELKPGDWVVEIGPGPGVLTELLLEQGCHVVAIEKDTVFAGALNRLQNSTNSLEVCCGDIMDFSFEEHLKKKMPQGVKAKVVANIPYHLTSPIIEKILSSPNVIQSATLMVQEEVARRCVASPGGADFSSFSVFLQFYSHVRYGFLVPPNCFYPPPKVDSAVIRFDLQKKFSLADEEGFFKMVRCAFMQRRKMAKSSLRQLYESENIENAFHKLGKNPQVRPEELSLEEWVQFFGLLQAPQL
jgi:16S rRNA (adenine1518-N6/adenine1519-N6)-dimethyltransferase